MFQNFVETPQGLFLNQLRRYAKSSVLVPDQALTPLVIPAAPLAVQPSSGTPLTIEGPQDCVTEVYSAIAEHSGLADVTNRLSCSILDVAWRRRYSNRDILVDHVFGTNLGPFFFKETVFLDQQQTLLFQFFNNSTAGASTLRFMLEAMKLQKTALDYKDVQKDVDEERIRKTFFYPFWFTTDNPVTLAPSQVLDVFMTNTTDVYLYLFYFMSRAIVTAGPDGDTQEVFAFELFDPKTDRPLQNFPVTRNCGTGTARFPYRLPHPLLVEPRTQIRIRLTNLITTALSTNEIFATLAGVAQFTGEGLWNAPKIRQETLGPVLESVLER